MIWSHDSCSASHGHGMYRNSCCATAPPTIPEARLRIAVVQYFHFYWQNLRLRDSTPSRQTGFGLGKGSILCSAEEQCEAAVCAKKIQNVSSKPGEPAANLCRRRRPNHAKPPRFYLKSPLQFSAWCVSACFFTPTTGHWSLLQSYGNSSKSVHKKCKAEQMRMERDKDRERERETEATPQSDRSGGLEFSRLQLLVVVLRARQQ